MVSPPSGSLLQYAFSLFGYSLRTRGPSRKVQISSGMLPIRSIGSPALKTVRGSRTEPEAFFLDIYFNAHPVGSTHAKDKPKPSNALVPTSIAYSGGQRDFAVNMGLEVCGSEPKADVSR